MSTPPSNGGRLKKELGLFDVYAISTGAMFSSGFFLLPGLAAAQTGPSVALAYLVAGLFMLPALLSVAELSTAMPRAGGAYYFLDRALGPLMGTVGGLGTWLALILKSAFALVGLGAYLALYVDVPVGPLAVGLTGLFMVVNIIGAKETSALQRWLVGVLLGVLFLFVLEGTITLLRDGVSGGAGNRFSPFMPFGFTGFMGTVGFVFVSYAGLTKVASVSEEVSNPDKNIPRGMFLSLATATIVYTVGVYLLVALVEPNELRTDLTPVATAAEGLFQWLPPGVGVGLLVVAAVAAFASTGNAGILSASRYPLAMARDRLVPSGLNHLGRHGTPTRAILLTSGTIAAAILLFDVASIAKLASAFQLLLFAFLNLAVIIMRESRIEGYDPGYRSPWYPWTQIIGLIAPFWLIVEMGQLAVLFTLGLIALTLIWYFKYAGPRVVRQGAILHTLARLGQLRHEGLDRELRSIALERGLREQDPFDEIVARSPVRDLEGPVTLETLSHVGAEALAQQLDLAPESLAWRFDAAIADGRTPISRGAMLPHLRLEGLDRPHLALVRCREGVVSVADDADHDELAATHMVVFLASPMDEPGRHLRLLGHLATHLDDPDCMNRWLAADGHAELRETLLREDRSILLDVGPGPEALPWAGLQVMHLDLPEGCLITTIRREGRGMIPRGPTQLEEGDRLTLIGEKAAIEELVRRARRPDPSEVPESSPVGTRS